MVGETSSLDGGVRVVSVVTLGVVLCVYTQV